MSHKLPRFASEEIRLAVYQRADEHQYINRSRPDNSIFIETLMADEAVGGRLKEYMPEANVRGYLVDHVLNRYAKSKRQFPRDLTDILLPLYGEVSEIEYRSDGRLSLHRTQKGQLIVVAQTAHVKWETGLRKLVQYVAVTPGVKTAERECVDFLLLIYQHDSYLDESDKQVVIQGLSRFGICCRWV